MLTVTTQASNYDLVSLGVVRSELDITGNSQDERLTRLIKQASNAISCYCNRVFAQETVIETFRTRVREDGLLLTRYPATSIVSVTENDVTLTASDYELATPSLLNRLRDDNPTCWPIGKIVVAYVAGYTATTLPKAIERAAIMLIGYYRLRDGGDILKRSDEVVGIGAHSYQDFPDGATLPPEVAALVSDFRKSAGA